MPAPTRVCVLLSIHQHAFSFSELLAVGFKIMCFPKTLVFAILPILFLVKTRRGLHPWRPLLVISALLARWCLNSVVKANKQYCRMSTRPVGSFTAPSVDITALLSKESKAQAHNGALCQNKYSKEIETTQHNLSLSFTHTHTRCVGMRGMIVQTNVFFFFAHA